MKTTSECCCLGILQRKFSHLIRTAISMAAFSGHDTARLLLTARVS